MARATDHINQRIAAPCASCGEYQMAGVHMIEDEGPAIIPFPEGPLVIEGAVNMRFFCSRCCPACKEKCGGQSDKKD